MCVYSVTSPVRCFVNRRYRRRRRRHRLLSRLRPRTSSTRKLHQTKVKLNSQNREGGAKLGCKKLTAGLR